MNELLITYGPDRIIERFQTRYEAEAAWSAIVDHYEAQGTVEARRLATRFGVRSIEDPRWSSAPFAGNEEREVRLIAKQAAKKARRKELGKTATMFVRDAQQGASLDGVIRKVLVSMTERGFQLDRWEAQDAVKARVIIGREMLGGGYYDRGAGYWAPKKEGPLHELRSPRGRVLGQSTLQLKSGFVRL